MHTITNEQVRHKGSEKQLTSNYVYDENGASHSNLWAIKKKVPTSLSRLTTKVPRNHVRIPQAQSIINNINNNYYFYITKINNKIRFIL